MPRTADCFSIASTANQPQQIPTYAPPITSIALVAKPSVSLNKTPLAASRNARFEAVSHRMPGSFDLCRRSEVHRISAMATDPVANRTAVVASIVGIGASIYA